MKNKDLVKTIFGEIALIQEQLRALDAITSDLRIYRQYYDDKPDGGNLRRLLIEKELELWRNLFMWAMTLPQKEIDRIKAAAYERFLDKCSVSHWLGNPTSWSQATEDEFREMARKAFKPADME